MASGFAIEVVFLPRDLEPHHLAGRAVVVFDVLRATTSITAALAAGVKAIHIFPTVGHAAQAKAARPANALLCGEQNCLPPPGFDLGNSPGAFDRSLHQGRDMLMSTTNGTRAILAAGGAQRIFAGALVNAAAVARILRRENLPVTLLCAGTDGALAMEDVLGAGAVIDALSAAGSVRFDSDAGQIAHHLFLSARNDLSAALRSARGGMNLIQASLSQDIDFCARLDVLDVVGVAHGNPPVITANQSDP
jgi:2-phosphosulfolactate phosphatase